MTGENNAKKTPCRGKGRPFKPGNPGKPKGAKNKISKNIKENFEAVFTKLGGIEGFCKWAEENRQTKGAFYQMYSKMLPSNVDLDVKGGITVKQQFEDRLDEYFEEQGRDGIANFFKELGAVVVPGNKRTNH